MTKSRVVSTRLKISELAKARDGLIERGISPENITTISDILKTTFYYGILNNCDDPKSPASEESLQAIKQFYGKTKVTKGLNIEEL